MMKRLLVIALAAFVALLPLSMVQAGMLTIGVPKTELTVTNAGDIDLRPAEEEDDLVRLKVDGREYTGIGVTVSINHMDQMADVLLTSNLDLEGGIGDHDGTLDFAIGGDMLNLEYDGEAMLTKDMVMHTKIIKSHGDFKVTDGTGMFEALKGVEGTYMLKIVEHGKEVGSMAGFKFLAKEVVEVEDVEDVEEDD